MTEPSDEIITSEEQAVRVKAEVAGGAPGGTWHAFRSADIAAAARLANTTPAQGAGEAVFSVSDNGTVDVFLFF